MSDSTASAVDFDGYRNIIEQATHHWETPHYWVIGTLAPYREWEAIREEAEFDEEPARYMDAIPIECREGVKRYGDFQYPAWGFVDDEGTGDIERADAQLAGLTAFPEEAVRTDHHRVLSPGALLDVIDDIEASLGSERVLLTGVFNPHGGRFSIQDEESVHRMGMTRFPSGVFADSGIRSGIFTGNGVLHGTLIFERGDLTRDVLDIVDGEADEASYDEASEGGDA